MSENQSSRDNFEEHLRRIRVAEPPSELRRQVLDACRRDARTTTSGDTLAAWWSWQSWRLEQALCATILVCLAVLVWLRGSGVGMAGTQVTAEAAAETAEVAEVARRLARSLDQSELTAEYLTVQLARNRRVRELESSRRVRQSLRSQKGFSPWS